MNEKDTEIPASQAKETFERLIDAYSGGGDYGDDDDYDEYEDGDDHYFGDDQYDGSDYSAGYQDGYAAGLRAMTLRYRLTILIPYRVRAKYYALRRRVFPHNNDIPF
jgi:hypothetical protein